MFKDIVFLTQTDTAIGFISQNKETITKIKQRLPNKHYIKAVNNLETLQVFTRVPLKHRNIVRRSKKSTFVMPNTHSYRVIYDNHHLLLLNRLKWAYTSSANISGESYDENFAKNNANVIVEPLLDNKASSRIYKLGKNTLKRIR